jgi:hypothetical protein
MTAHLVLGRQVTMPVDVRTATAGTAMFAVPAGKARAAVDGTGLTLVEPVPGRALCSLAFIQYVDGDLGQYHEFGVTFLVRPAGGGQIGTYVHWLPVDQEFTLAAGRSIWGFPKELADIALTMEGPTKRCIVRQGGRLVLALLLRPGLPVPAGRASLHAYTRLDGVTRRIPWTMRAGGIRSRPGGALVLLGDHPVADELRAFGLPRTALVTSTIRQLQMTFQDAEPA